ncbi:hypothetical protein [Streptomyces sp. NPDC005795]|uniref:hypothetical protein n=1 Tax=Streptomyces sp. NPDC005795 TaxID=3154677 RepID=UPI0033F6C2D6
MTHDIGSTPRIPTEVPEAPEAANQPRSAGPGGAADHRTADTRPMGTGATGTARIPEEAVAGRPPMTAPAAATLPGDGLPEEPAPHTGANTAGNNRPLFPDGDHDRLTQRLQHAVSEFVENPRLAVEEAERTFDTVVDGLTDSLQEHRRALAAAGRDGDPDMRTEELRVTLQHYRDLTERLLNV